MTIPPKTQLPFEAYGFTYNWQLEIFALWVSDREFITHLLSKAQLRKKKNYGSRSEGLATISLSSQNLSLDEARTAKYYALTELMNPCGIILLHLYLDLIPSTNMEGH